MRIAAPVRKRFPPGRKKALWLAIAACAAGLLFLLSAARFFHKLTGAMAVSNASDLITRTVSDIVEEKMRDPQWQAVPFVSFEKDDRGVITAIVTDTTRVNILSSELLGAVISAANAGDLSLHVPLGDLLGFSLLLGKGPRIPMRITLLTSSRVEVENILTDAGINQTRHRILLRIDVFMSILLPGFTTSARVSNEISVAETVIVGGVPENYTYFSTLPEQLQQYAEDYIMNNG